LAKNKPVREQWSESNGHPHKQLAQLNVAETAHDSEFSTQNLANLLRPESVCVTNGLSIQFRK